MISIINSILFLIVCHWWAGVFVNKFRHFGQTIFMCRVVTTLDGTWDKKQAWRPHVRTWGLSEANVLFWKSAYDSVVTFGPPQWFGARGIVPPCPPSLRLCCYAIKIIGKFSENKQIFKSERHELLFHEHLQFSNTIGLPHGSCTDCQQRLLATFHVSSCSFVSLLILPTRFFGVELYMFC